MVSCLVTVAAMPMEAALAFFAFRFLGGGSIGQKYWELVVTVEEVEQEKEVVVVVLVVAGNTAVEVEGKDEYKGGEGQDGEDPLLLLLRLTSRVSVA